MLKSVIENWNLPHFRLQNNEWIRGVIYSDNEKERTIVLYKKINGEMTPFGIGHY